MSSTVATPKAILNVSVSSKIKKQDVLAGTADFTFAEYILDTRKSQTDILVNALKPFLTISKKNVMGVDIINCKLWDGKTEVAAFLQNFATQGEMTFAATGNGLLVPKGTAKTLALKCFVLNVPSSLSGTTFAWGIKKVQNQIPTSVVASGVGADVITINISPSTGVAMTLRSTGELAIVRDATTPAAGGVKCGQTNVPALAIKLSAAYEDISLKALEFKAKGATVSKFYLYNGSQKLGESASNKISLSEQFIIPKGQQKIVTILADLAAEPCLAGKTFSVSYAGSFEATGVTTGKSIPSTSKNKSAISGASFKLAK